MTDLLVTIIGLIVIAIIFFWWWDRSRPLEKPARIASLRRRYRLLVRVSPEEADAMLDRTVARLRERHPGKRLEWYFQRAIGDLRWDQR